MVRIVMVYILNKIWKFYLILKSQQFGSRVTESDLDPKLCGLSFWIVYLFQLFKVLLYTSPSFKKV